MPPGVIRQDTMILRQTPDLCPEISRAARKAVSQHDARPGTMDFVM